MQSKTANRIKHFGMIAAVLVGMSACNGTDSTQKTADQSVATDSSTIAASAAATSDSVKAAKAKKKKGKTSVAGPVETTDKMVKDAHGVYNRAETMPEFPGGQTALANYINNNLTYSQTAIDNSTDGTIHVTFVVDEKGKVMNPQAMGGKTLGNGLDEETLRVFNKMPAWKPGTVKGKNVKTRLEIPITFQLEDAGTN